MKDITPIPFPKHARKFVSWHEDGKSGTAYIAVGYCQNNISYYVTLCRELANDIPEVDIDHIVCSKITRSDCMDGFTIVFVHLDFGKREIPGYTERKIDFKIR
jgi:hypothetical protein